MIGPVRDPHVWRSVRALYVGAGALFLANIGLGIANVFTDTIGRGQLLAHFHAGTIGWITLGVIATTIWVFTGDRNVSKRYAGGVAALTGLGIAAVAGYIAAFYLAFQTGEGTWLLPVFGIPAALVIWSAFGFAAGQMPRQPVLTTAHLLLVGALFVASLGALMGVLRGLALSTGVSLVPAAGDAVGAHAGPMDMYLALAFAAILEMFVRTDDQRPWSKPGATQMVLGVLAAVVVVVALYFGVMVLAPIAMLLFLLSFLFYFGRIGWRTFTVNPFRKGHAAAVFWGGVAFPVYIVLFVVLVMVYFIPEEPLPHALGVIFAHVTFIGAGTNTLLAAQLGYANRPAREATLATIGVWTLNVGMLLFFAEEIVTDGKFSALVMATGVLLALAGTWRLLGTSKPLPPRAPVV